MTDELEKLSDAELSERFAVEVAKTHVAIEIPRANKVWKDQRSYTRLSDGAFFAITPGGNGCAGAGCFKPFATSADAVLPWLEKAHHIRVMRCPINNNQWLFAITQDRGDEEVLKSAPTFARAAALALLRAARAAKGVA